MCPRVFRPAEGIIGPARVLDAGMTDEIDKRTIIVGVDGSDSSLDALRWARRQADLTGAELVAVTAWSYPTDASWVGIATYLPENFDGEQNAKDALAQSVDKALGADHAAGVRQKVVSGTAVEALLAEAEATDVELLVVGERGYGPVRSALIGSVSHAVIHHAHCPVVVVRGTVAAAEN